MSNLCASIFGIEFEWTVSTAVLILILVQAILVGVALIAFLLLVARRYAKSKSRQNILVTHAMAGSRSRAVTGISVDASAAKRNYRVGEPFESDGLVVTANYADGEPASETVTGYTVDPPDMDRAGIVTVTVGYGGFTATYAIEIAAEEGRDLIGLSLDASAVRKTFKAGEPFECGGLTVLAMYGSEPFSEEIYGYSVEEPDMETPGEKQVVVRYGDFVEIYLIEVLPAEKKRVLAGIDLDLSVVKTDFLVGEPFDCEGLGVTARYEGEPDGEPVTDFTVDAPDLSVKGMVNVVVRYGGFSQTYPVFVAEGRALVGISLDTSVVRREFAEGEEFNCSGLIVTADYDAEPFSEEISDFEVETPDMSAEGEREVLVSYLGKSASYTVSVVKPRPAGAEYEPEDEGETSLMCYDRSFTARLIQSGDDTKRWYGMIKNELLSYRKVKDRMSWKKETYRLGREPVAKLGFRGKVLCIFLALDPAAYAESKYKVEDVSMNKSFEDTPCLYRIKGDMRAKRAVELIAAMMENLGVERTEREPEDYYLPYENIRELVEKGLAKRFYINGETFENLAKPDGEEPAAEEAAVADANPAPATEEPAADNYDKSFRAKVILSDEETKGYYSVLKNELLSYRGMEETESWNRETFEAEGRTMAKLSYRDTTLCLFLPIDPAAYADARYKVEDASASKPYRDTPCMFRVKNFGRLEFALEMIGRMMGGYAIPKEDKPIVDYAEPAREFSQLIEEGLVREAELREEQD